MATRAHLAHPFEIVVGQEFFDLIELRTGARLELKW